MTAGLYDQLAEQGALFEFDGEFYDDAEAIQPHDFTAHDGVMIVRRRRSEDAPEVTRCTVSDGRITFPQPTLGQVHIEIPADDTEQFPIGCFHYWLSFWPMGVEEDALRWLEGEFEIAPGGGETA